MLSIRIAFEHSLPFSLTPALSRWERAGVRARWNKEGAAARPHALTLTLSQREREENKEH